MLDALRARVDEHLARVLDGAGLAPTLRDAAAYALLGGGKRVRPVLTLLGAQASAAAAGCDTERALRAALPPAAALELVHAFSLVHDDLPALDNDDLRRGRPTLHVHAGEAMAVLAGDALLALAFAALRFPAAGAPALGDHAAAACAAEVARATLDMISGQVWDTLGGLPAGLDDRARLDRIHSHKTGALIRAACRCGAIAAFDAAPPASAGSPGAGGHSPDHAARFTRTLDTLTAYADAVGLVFQIVDDLIDVEQSAEHTGKRTGKDAQAGKLTFPGVLGVDASRAEVVRLSDLAVRAARSLGPGGDALATLAQRLAQRTR